MSKVKIVTSSKEQSKITSIGEIKFDADGVSIDSYDRASIERIVDASPSLSIEGETKVIMRKSPAEDGEVGIQETESTKSDFYTQEQVNKMLLDNAERLILRISEALGIEYTVIEAALISPITKKTEEIEEVNSTRLGSTGETDLQEVEQEKDSIESAEVMAARESMKGMKIDELRDILIKGGVDESVWSALKGNEGKKEMIELIINIAKTEE